MGAIRRDILGFKSKQRAPAWRYIEVFYSIMEYNGVKYSIQYNIA